MLLTFVTSTAVNKAEDFKSMTYEQLLTQYKQDSTILNKLDIQYKLDEKAYKDSLEDYKDLEENVEIMTASLSVYDQLIDQTIKQSEEAGKRDTVDTPYGRMNAKEYYMQYELPLYMNIKSSLLYSYEGLIKTQLDLYMPMEMLKLKLSLLENEKEQAVIASENKFKKLCMDYALAMDEIDLLKFKQTFYEREIDKAKKELELGLIKPIELHQKENQLIALGRELIKAHNTRDEKYNQIKAQLKLEENTSYQFLIEWDQKEALNPLDDDSFYNCVINGSSTIKNLKRQLEVLDEIDYLAKTVYDEDEYKLLLTLKNNEKDRISINKNLQQMDVLIDKYQLDYQTAYEIYLIAIDQYKIANEEYKNSQLKYEIGQISELNFDNAKLEFLQARKDYYEAINTYLTAYYQYEEAIYGILSFS